VYHSEEKQIHHASSRFYFLVTETLPGNLFASSILDYTDACLFGFQPINTLFLPETLSMALFIVIE
jgi:hypothetical protein